MSFCLMKSQMMRVISSPSISTMGFSTLILDMVGAPGFGVGCRGYIRGGGMREGLAGEDGPRGRGAVRPARNRGRSPPRHRQAAPRTGDFVKDARTSEAWKVLRDKVRSFTAGSPARGLSMAPRTATTATGQSRSPPATAHLIR